jgi:beta-glucanase (GH16 family)
MAAWAAILGLAATTAGPAVTPQAAEWKLVWSDEFNGREIDRTKWDYDIGNGFWNYDEHLWIPGWGNAELQYYTREPESVFRKPG